MGRRAAKRTGRGMGPGLGGALLLSALLAFPGGARADEVEDLLARPPAEALERLAELLAAVDPADGARRARLLRARARIELARGRAAAAVADLEAADALADPRPAEQLLKARALYEAGVAEGQRPGGAVAAAYFEDALLALGGLLEEPPAGGEGLEVLDLGARLHTALGRAEEALALRRRVDPATLPEPWRAAWQDALARTCYALGRFEEAAEAFLAAGAEAAAAAAFDAARRPERSVPLYAALLARAPADRALAEQALGGARYLKAQRMLAQALAEQPVPEGEAGLERLVLLGLLWEEAGDAARALERFEAATARVPLDARAWKGIARTTPRADRDAERARERAIEAWEKALLLDPEDEEAFGGLAWFAGEDYQRLWRLGPEHPVARRCLRVQEALVEATAGEDALVLGNLGNTLRVLGRTAEALEAYARARRANPYDPDVASDQGLALAAAGRPGEALAAFLEAVELDPSNVAARQNAARFLYKAGRHAEAAAHLVAAEQSARAVGRPAGVYRHLLDRAWRGQQATAGR